MMGGSSVSLVNKGCKHNVVSHNALINGYCKNQKVDQAMRLYRECLMKGLDQQLLYTIFTQVALSRQVRFEILEAVC